MFSSSHWCWGPWYNIYNSIGRCSPCAWPPHGPVCLPSTLTFCHTAHTATSSQPRPLPKSCAPGTCWTFPGERGYWLLYLTIWESNTKGVGFLCCSAWASRVSQKNETPFLLNISPTKYRFSIFFFSWKLRSIGKFWMHNHFCAIFEGWHIYKTKRDSWLHDSNKMK